MMSDLKAEGVDPAPCGDAGGDGDHSLAGSLAKLELEPKAPVEEGKVETKSVNLFDLYKGEGNGFVRTCEYDKALMKYDLAWDQCKTDDDKAMILNNRGVVWEKMGDLDKAMSFFNEALVLKPAYIKVLVRRAQISNTQKRFESAIEDIAEANVLSLKLHQAVSGLQEVISSIIMDWTDYEVDNLPDDRKFVFPKGHQIRGFFRQFYSDPFSRLWKGLDPWKDDNNPTKELFGFFAAVNCMNEERYTEIPDHCTKEIESEGWYRFEASLVRGSFSLLCGKRTEAEADFKAIINDENSTKKMKSNAYVKMAVLMNLWSTAEETANQYAEAEMLWKENCDVYYHAALNLIDKGEGIPALALLEKGIEICPDPKTCPVLHVLCLTIQLSFSVCCNSPKTSIGKLKEMANSGLFDIPECFEYFAQSLLMFDGIEASLIQFDQAEKLSNGEKIYELKKVMAQQVLNQDPDATVKCLEQFTEDPQVGNTAWYHIGEMLFILGKKEEALEAMNKSIELSHSVFDIKTKVLGRNDFKFNIVLAEKMKSHGLIDLDGKEDDPHNSLE